MDDKKIVDLYWERSENAISETRKKYGKYCHYIAFNILYSNEDAEECVSDTYLKAWETMPPRRPERLSTFLGKLTRNIALNRHEKEMAQKRSAFTETILEEAKELVPHSVKEAEESSELLLKEAVNGFIRTLSENTRIIFLRRYWYMCPIKEIAASMDISESSVKVILLRTRKKFKEYLEKEGITV